MNEWQDLDREEMERLRAMLPSPMFISIHAGAAVVPLDVADPREPVGTGYPRAALAWLDRVAEERTSDLRAERDRLKEEVARLEAILRGEPELVRTRYDGPGTPLEVAIRHPIVLSMVAAWREVLDSVDAPNYVSCEMHDLERDDPQVHVVTVQRKHGKSPQELRKLAEAERDEARRDICDMAAAFSGGQLEPEQVADREGWGYLYAEEEC